MIVYICGPISGLPDGNKPAFDFAQEQLLRMGHYPINPHNVCMDIVRMHEGTDWELWAKCMKRDIPEMLKADAVLLLEGWEYSNGARLERALALDLGIQVIGEEYLFDSSNPAYRPTREPEQPSNQ